MAFASGEVAAPASPSEPERASGAIIRKGTAVVMVFSCRLLMLNFFCCAETKKIVNICAKKITGVIDNSELKNKKRLYGTSFIIDYPKVITDLPRVAVILKVAAYRDEIAKQLLSLNPNVVFFEGESVI